MKTKKVTNKAGEVLKSKDNIELVENTLEAGDEFVPCFNSVLDKSREIVDEDGKKKTIHNFLMKARVRDKNGSVLKNAKGEDEIFLKLTPTQAKSLKKKVEAGTEINQELFVVYNYESVEHGTQVGVGIKGKFKQPKTFADFEDVKFNKDVEDAIDLDAIEEEDFNPNE